MTITTKYGIGDKVWRVFVNDRNRLAIVVCMVEEVRTVIKPGVKRIAYYLSLMKRGKRHGLYDGEENLFRTRAEAKDEVKTRTAK